MEGQRTNIRESINIDGYYRNDISEIMFFEDGTWVYFSFKEGLSENEIRNNMSKSVVSWIKNKKFNWGTYWGVYKIKGDTIILNSYDEEIFMVKGWSLNEIQYKIIDKNTIQQIYFNSKLFPSENTWLYLPNLIFFIADSLPSSDNWLKEKKWIWRNESDWKAYMEKKKRIKFENNKVKMM